MSDVVALARRVGQIEVSPQFSDYSKVLIHIDDETVIEIGNDTGRTLEFTCPFATQQMAQDILSSLTGFQYQPFRVTDALMDPAAEIGDAANTRGSYGGIYSRNTKFSEMMPADIAAPQDEEINHEYKYESPQERQFKRQIDDVKASLIIANDRIDAKVSQTGGTNSTFGWSLTSSAHTWYANGSQVMKISKAGGLEVSGKVTATSGKIGGFTIGASAIYNNISSFGGSQSSGVYIGTNGIQLGQRFKVDTQGNVTASNMKLTGTLTIGDSTISANDLRLGAQRANSGYSDWNSTSNTVYSNGSYWSGGASNGNSAKATWDAAQDSYRGVSYMRIRTIVTDNAMTYMGSSIRKLQMKVNGVTYYYLGWAYPN